MTDGWTYEYSYPIPGEAARLFAALTREEELERWFAEHARIDAREGGDFAFWGRHTVGTPAEGEAGGTITAFEPDRQFGFEWEMLGAPSTVTIDLTPEETKRGPATRVAIRQEFERMFERPRAREMVDDWWRFNVGNLMAHTAEGRDVLRVDFDDPSPEIRLSMHMKAPPEKVFRALTEPEALNRWMGKDASVDLREGGAWDLGWPAPEGYEGPGMTIVELVPDRKLSITWPDWRGDTSVPTQTVTWELEPAEDGTLVTLTHAGFVRAVDLSDYPFGWGHFLGQLKDVAESL
ncbi:MAG: SRPBCC family protein [Gemmatimonadota bacterium]|jgi:uncharacterized protein YndB with AHSA1/START domain